jgi:mono/diheme cytochrome c family protein
LLTPADIHAAVVYLRSISPTHNLPPVQHDPAAAAKDPDMNEPGAKIFAGECQGCHAWDGQGVQSPEAALIGNRTLNDPAATNLVRVLLEGVDYRTPGGEIYMPRFALGHSNQDLAELANFVAARFGNGSAHLTADDIAKARRGTPAASSRSWLSRAFSKL